LPARHAYLHGIITASFDGGTIHDAEQIGSLSFGEHRVRYLVVYLETLDILSRIMREQPAKHLLFAERAVALA
jgi:hypothetical protein